MIKDPSLIKNIKESIISAKSIAISGHISPDGDCLGSSLSLYLAIKKINPKVKIIKNDDLPDYLSILSATEEMLAFNKEDKFDLFIACDCASSDRLGNNYYHFKNAKKSICIDHHQSNIGYCDINLIDPQASSTCELIYELVEAMNIEYDRDMAQNTLIGILTDTNRFLYSSTTSNTLLIASKLLSFDFDKNKIMQALYQSNPLSSVKLTSLVIDKMKLYKENQLAMASITIDDLKEVGASDSDLEDKINLIRDIDTVELACLIKQKDSNRYKISLRSKNYVNCAEICEEFGGGGHLRAAGFSYEGKLEDLEEKLLERFDKIDW